MTHYIMRTSYLCEVSDDVYYQWLIGNYLFIITNKYITRICLRQTIFLINNIKLERFERKNVSLVHPFTT